MQPNISKIQISVNLKLGPRENQIRPLSVETGQYPGQCTSRVVTQTFVRLLLATCRNVCCGRVEDGRGSLGPMANAPFPIPAHQTGRADFRHPAFRLASPQGTRRHCSGQALEAQNAEFSMNYIECESAIAAPLHLVPSREEPARTFKDVLVDATVCLAPRAVAKVVGPASQ
jgi:hypothetical protein